MKQALILYNTQSGHARIAGRLADIVDIFRDGGYEVRAEQIRFGRNPFEEVRDADLVVACGGDGTVNYVINSMKREGLDLPIGIIPAGTANDFAGAIGMKRNFRKAARQIVSGRAERLDCGCVNGLYFINIFSFGLFTTTSQHTPDEIKHRIGRLAYVIEGSKELRRSEFIPLHITHDGGETDVRSLLTLVFNGETAGGFRLARKASVRDGKFDLLLLDKCGPVAAAAAIVLFLITGRPNFAVRHIRSSRIGMTSEFSPVTDVDGQRGPEFPLSIECVAGGVSIVCPAK